MSHHSHHYPGPDFAELRDQMLATMLALIDTLIPGQRFAPAGLSYQHWRQAR
jgi:hypothetical protein